MGNLAQVSMKQQNKSVVWGFSASKGSCCCIVKRSAKSSNSRCSCQDEENVTLKQMVLLMQKVRDLEIHLNNPKQKQGNGRGSPLLSLNIKKRVEEAQQKMKAS